jgi:hypothetical protein
MRGGSAKVEPMSRGEKPWRVESPGELRASGGLNSRRGVADSRAEQTPEGGGVSAGLFDPVKSGLRAAGSHRFGGAGLVSSRHLGVACPADPWRFGGAGAKGFRRLGGGLSAAPPCFGTEDSVLEAGDRGRRLGDGLGNGVGASAAASGTRLEPWQGSWDRSRCFGNGFGSPAGQRVRATSVVRAR